MAAMIEMEAQSPSELSSGPESISEFIQSDPEYSDIRRALRILDAKDWSNMGEYTLPRGEQEITIVHLAAIRGNLEILQRAEVFGVDLLATDKFGRSAFFYAVGQGHINVMEWMLERWVVQNRPEKMKYSDHPQLAMPDVYGNTPLHEATRRQQVDAVKLLVKVGCEVDAKNNEDQTPLLLAGTTCSTWDTHEKTLYEKTIDTLVASYASVNASDTTSSQTPLHHAAKLDSSHALDVLLRAGACMEAMDKNRWTPLYVAAYRGNLTCVRSLVVKGTSLASETNDGATSIDALLAHGEQAVELVKEILDAGAQMKDRNDDVTLNFGPLAPEGESQTAVCSALIQAKSKKEKPKILEHPLVEAYIGLKWSSLHPCFVILMVLHALFFVCVSLYSVIVIHQQFSHPVGTYLMLTFAIIQLGYYILQLIMMPKHYAKQFETWISLAGATFCIIIAVADKSDEDNKLIDCLGGDQPCPNPTWIQQLLRIAILFSSLQLILLFRRFPSWGYHSIMLPSILKDSLKILLPVGCIMYGISLMAAILFPGNGELGNPLKIFGKTFSMMEDDSGTGNSCSVNNRTNPTADGSTDPNDMTETTFSPIAGHVMFLIFVLLLGIVMMNESHTQRSINQIEFITHLGKISRNWIFQSPLMPKRFSTWIIKSNTIDTKIVWKSSAMNRYFLPGISKAIGMELFHLALRNRRVHERFQTVRPHQENSDGLCTGTIISFLGEEIERLQREKSRLERNATTTI